LELKASLVDLPKIAKKVLSIDPLPIFIAFFGDLGAGKTTLIKNICNLLGVIDDVSSPTYSLVNEYLDREGNSVYHFDFYRIEDEVEALDMGCEEYFYSGNMCLVEWPEMISNLLPEERLEIHIAIDNEERIFTLKHVTNVR